MVFKNCLLPCITGDLFYGSHMGVFMWHSQVECMEYYIMKITCQNITSWRSHAKISKLWCWLLLDKVFFSDNLGYCTHGLQFYLKPMKPCLHFWLRCVMGIHLFYSSIASTGNMLVWEGPQPDAVVCMLRMFLRMLNTVMWLYPASAVSWHLMQPPVCLCL